MQAFCPTCRTEVTVRDGRCLLGHETHQARPVVGGLHRAPVPPLGERIASFVRPSDPASLQTVLAVVRYWAEEVRRALRPGRHRARGLGRLPFGARWEPAPRPPRPSRPASRPEPLPGWSMWSELLGLDVADVDYSAPRWRPRLVSTRPARPPGRDGRHRPADPEEATPTRSREQTG